MSDLLNDLQQAWKHLTFPQLQPRVEYIYRKEVHVLRQPAGANIAGAIDLYTLSNLNSYARLNFLTVQLSTDVNVGTRYVKIEVRDTNFNSDSPLALSVTGQPAGVQHAYGFSLEGEDQEVSTFHRLKLPDYNLSTLNWSLRLNPSGVFAGDTWGDPIEYGIDIWELKP